MLPIRPALLFLFWPILLLLAVRNEPFFWDTVQLASKHAHFFYENGLRWLPLPPEIDSGHPPFLGFYLALCWAIFGKTLIVSHLAVLPFQFGIVWLLGRLGQRLGGEWGLWLLPICLLDPVLAGQMALVSPDVLLFFFFLWSVEAFFSKKRLWMALGCAGLCVISMRGMMVAGAVFVWFLAQHLLEASNHQNWKTCAKSLLNPIFLWSCAAFLPGFLLAAAFLGWHWAQTGWIGFHPGSSWSPAFERVSAGGFAKNLAVFVWRWLDFGRFALWILLFWALFFRRAQVFFPFLKPSSTDFSQKNLRALGVLLLVLLLFLSPSALLYQNLSAHRYFLPLFGVFNLLVFFLFSHAKFYKKTKIYIFCAFTICMAAGNLWRHPLGISMDWDATLGHLPFHAARREMLDFIENQKLPYSAIGAAFPARNTGENLELNGDSRLFAEVDFEKNNFVLWSNVCNDFSREDHERLCRDWILLKKVEQSGVFLALFQRK